MAHTLAEWREMCILATLAAHSLSGAMGGAALDQWKAESEAEGWPWPAGWPWPPDPAEQEAP